ncbi:MAG: DUF4315 family protein [Oscillospiraceae bacterium]|nr:DUF4315 family protein [Oscillospiraceae bacterium]
MNPKVVKLKEELEKNSEKIVKLQARNKTIKTTIIEIENTDIIGMVRDYGLSPDQLMELLRELKQTPIPEDSVGTMKRTEVNALEE